MISWRGWKELSGGNGGRGRPWAFAKDRARSAGKYKDKAVHPRYVKDPEKSIIRLTQGGKLP